MKPTILWALAQPQEVELPDGGVLVLTYQRGRFLVLPPDDVVWANLHQLLQKAIGSVNRTALAFRNHIALPETLVLTDDHWPSEADPQRFELRIVAARTRGRCEDGLTRHIGWNRCWRPESRRFERVLDTAGNGPYAVGDTLAQLLASCLP